MKEILFLAHRIPYPPNKGDKIRAYHLLKWLTARYRVHVGTFVDEVADWQYAAQLKEFCADTCLRPLNPALARLRSLRGFLTGAPLTFPYYRDQVMQLWVDRVLSERPIHAAIAFSACMAQYVSHASDTRRIVDFVDLDSDKWRQFAATQVWPWSAVYRREARTLAEGEKRLATAFDASIFVSPAEARLFERVNPELPRPATVINNGVDTEFFAPQRRGVNPYATSAKVFAFTGAMNYWPNVDAVTWFVREVLPRIHQRIGDVELYIVGSRPTPAVLALAKEEGVRVTGAVPDVRPYIGYATAGIAPMRLARGVQNKVLEAMAMAKPVLMTSAARAGLNADAVCDSLVADDPEEFAAKAVMLTDAASAMEIGEQCRRFVQRHYDWERNLEALAPLLEPHAITAAFASTDAKVAHS